MKRKLCYRSLSNISWLFLDFIFFNKERKHVQTLANEPLKIFYKHYTPSSDKEIALNILQYLQNDFLLPGYISEMIDS